MKKNILIISPYIPWPLDSGGNAGVFYLLQYISKHVNVTFVSRYNRGGRDYASLSVLKTKLLGVDFILFDWRKSGMVKYDVYWKIAHKIAEKGTVAGKQKMIKSLPQLAIIPGFIRFINDLIVSRNIDIVQIEFLSYQSLVHALPDNVKKVFIHHELGWVIRSLRYNHDMYSDYVRKLQDAYEVSSLNSFDTVVALTEVDKMKMIAKGVHTDIVVSPLAITDRICPRIDNRYRDTLTFVGGGKHAPNRHGLHWFIKNVLPLVLKKHAETRLEIIGSWSEEAKSDIISLGGNVVFKGFVESLGEGLKGSIMVVPILIGSGMRMKILEAANFSVPFVSTVVGAEGLIFESGRDCFISDEPQEMADRIIRLIEDDNLYQQFSYNSHEKLLENYSIEVLGKKRLSIYE